MHVLGQHVRFKHFQTLRATLELVHPHFLFPTTPPHKSKAKEVFQNVRAQPVFHRRSDLRVWSPK